MASGMSAKRRWMASERIALSVLSEMGFRVLETGRRVVVNGVEVGEVDAIAEDSEGNVYAVEVKAGRLDVSGVRQAYVNALLVNAKPMVVCKGFSDDAARELAERLGVRVVQLSDVFLVESEELYALMREVVEEVLADYLEVFYGYSPQLKQEHLEVLQAIASSADIGDAAGKLGVDAQALARKIEELRRAGVLPRWAVKYSSVRRVAQVLVWRRSLASALEESSRLVETARALREELRELKAAVSGLAAQLKRLSETAAAVEEKSRASQAPGQQ